MLLSKGWIKNKHVIYRLRGPDEKNCARGLEKHIFIFKEHHDKHCRRNKYHKLLISSDFVKYKQKMKHVHSLIPHCSCMTTSWLHCFFKENGISLITVSMLDCAYMLSLFQCPHLLVRSLFIMSPSPLTNSINSP